MITLFQSKYKFHFSSFFSLLRRKYTYFYHSLLFVILFFSLFSFNVHEAKAKTMINDASKLLSSDELELITQKCDRFQKENNTSIYIIISKTIGKKDHPQKYIKKIGNSKNSPNNLIILFISTKNKDTFCMVNAFGKCKKNMTSHRCTKLSDKLTSQIRNNNAYSGLDSFCDSVLYDLNHKPIFDFILFQSIPQLFLCILLAGGCIYLILSPNSIKKSSILSSNSLHSEMTDSSDELIKTSINQDSQTNSWKIHFQSAIHFLIEKKDNITKK